MARAVEPFRIDELWPFTERLERFGMAGFGWGAAWLTPDGAIDTHRDVRAFLFVRQKIAAANWTNTQHIEIIRRHAAAVKLDRIAHAG